MIAEEPVAITAQEPTPQQAELAISVRGVGKMYRIYDRPQDRLKQMLFWRFGRHYGREFWALRDVSLEVRKGETVGIIGRNGSGKSTLLQIIAGTLAPSEGEVQVNGRVAALLELGSGFNPEFTGRENVYLNGAILGLSREEMDARFDEIAAFADIGEFIDQPVKFYSSGMVVRLAFAVSACIEPDILIVDEALAVGDIYFQHKCMRRIKSLTDRGTTLLFVTHTIETVKRFCKYGLWLESGETRYFGEAGVAAEKYLAFMRMREIEDWQVNEVSAEPLVDETDPSGAPQLVHVAHTIDLADERLFLQGAWRWASVTEAKLPVRVTSDPSACAGFRCTGTQIQLRFLRGPHTRNVRVTVDGCDRVVQLSSPGEHSIATVQLDVAPGDHTVLIRSDDTTPGSADQLYWLGGHVENPAPLVFQRDKAFGLDTGAVERYGTQKGHLTAVQLLDYVSNEPVRDLHYGQRVRLRIHAERTAPAGPRLEFSFIVRDRNRIDLFGTTTVDEGIILDNRATQFVVEFAFDVRLGPGSYSILVAFVECSADLQQRVPLDQVDMACVFTVGFNPQRPVWYVYYEPVEARASVFLPEIPDDPRAEVAKKPLEYPG